MPHNKDSIIIEKILREIGDIESDIEGFSRESFLQDGKTKRAVAMSLINIGELANHFSVDFKNEQASIPFAKIKGLRNIAAHGYHTLNFSFIWLTVTESVPELKKQLLNYQKMR